VAEYYNIPQENINDFAPALKALYWHARKNERIKMVKDMSSSGMKILLVGGDGWKSVFEEKNQVTIVSPCTHDCLTEYYMNSRAVVSTNCSNGANERTFDAQSCGAISIAENSITLENNFEDMKDIIFYDRLNLSSKLTVIEETIKNKSKGILISEEGSQNFINNNTWKHRVSDLYKVLEKTCANQVPVGCA
jgi:spore maturation protein CgeB